MRNEVRFLRIMRLGEQSDTSQFPKRQMDFFVFECICEIGNRQKRVINVLLYNTCTSFFGHAEIFRHTEKLLSKTDYVSFACQERASLFDKYDVE